jgi:nucleotide-binding universal stress UspA family protein
VVVPTDFSELSFAALETAIAIADDPANVHVVHVLIPPHPADPAVSIALDDNARAETVVKSLTEKLEALGHAGVQVHVRHGDPGSRFCEAAKELGADLVVVSSHGRTGIVRLLLGSVAERIVRLAPCPVLVVRGS